MSSPGDLPDAETQRAARGLWLGVLAMGLFGLTLPMTRLAIGPDSAPQLSPWFVTIGFALAVIATVALGRCLHGAKPRA